MKKLTLNSGVVSAEQTQGSAKNAQITGEQVASGDLDGAKDTICNSVQEMATNIG